MRVTYDGVELSDRFEVLLSEPQLIASDVSSERVGGRNGVVVKGTSLGTKRIDVRLVSRRTDADGMSQDRAWLAALLARGGVRRLVMPDGLEYDVAVSGGVDVTQRPSGMAVDVAFVATDPVGYGVKRTVRLSGDGASESFSVGGNMPATVSVSGAATPATAEQLDWLVSFGNDGYIKVQLPPTTGEHSITVDGVRRVVTVDGSVSVMTIDSDWVTLGPGRHTVTVSHGSCVVSVQERWLR
jgi:phage-related protein